MDYSPMITFCNCEAFSVPSHSHANHFSCTYATLRTTHSVPFSTHTGAWISVWGVWPWRQ
jgi:hypothetical protein